MSRLLALAIMGLLAGGVSASAQSTWVPVCPANPVVVNISGFVLLQSGGFLLLQGGGKLQLQ